MKKYYYIKCFLDYIVAFLLLIILIPGLIIISINIKLDSKGKVFFLQERLGQKGKIFKIIKFRTMVENAINIGDGLHTYAGDGRITKFGSFLRRTSLDELPQIFNVLKGEMSIIGPRPPVPYYPKDYEDYNKIQKQRFKIKPGISGYAQIMVRNSVSWDERIKLDITYLEKMSLLFDIKIFCLSIKSVFTQKDIY